MKIQTSSVIVAIAAVATIAGAFGPAYAGDRERYWRKHHSGRHFHDRAATSAVLGLAAGVVIGTALTQPRVVYRERPLYRDDPVMIDEDPSMSGEPDMIYPEAEAETEYLGPVEDYATTDDQIQSEDYFPEAPPRMAEETEQTAQRSLEPWTAEWRNYCKQRFQSFNATTGTYQGYDGKSHFCTAG